MKFVRVLFFLAVPFCSVLAQNAEPRFEVVSVKASPPSESGQNWEYKGGRFTARHVTLRTLVQQAYGLPDFLISGGPAWLDAGPTSFDRFDIEAKTDDNATRRQMVEMLRVLLQDRFKLKAHLESRELPGYNLSVGPRGHKLGPATGAQASAARLSGPGCHVIAENTSMSELANYLTYVVNRRLVWDKTGLDGRFNFKFDCVPETIRLSVDPDKVSPQDATERRPDGASIFDALKDALGLQLEPARAPVQLLVIDYVEKPSPN